MQNPDRPSSPSTTLGMLREAAPIWAFYLAEVMVGLTDLAVVGALGTDALAAVGLGKTVLLSVLTVGFAVVSVATVMMAENLSAKRCGDLLRGSLCVSLVFAISGVAVAAATPPLLGASGYADGFVALFDAYGTVLAFAIGPAMIFAALKNVLVAHGRTGIVFWISVGIVLGNLVASVLLVHGFGAWAGLGVSGAAWATVGVNVVAVTVLLAWVLQKRLVRFAGPIIGPALVRAREIVALGWAAGGQQMLESVLFVVVLFLLGLYSTTWLAAGTLVFAVMELNYAASAALGEVLSARLAAARSRGERALVMRLLRIGATLAGAGATGLGLLVVVDPHAIVSIFSGPATSEEARMLMADLLRWTAVFFLFDAWQVVFLHALRGLRRVVAPMLISSGCYWLVGLGGGIVLAELFGLEAIGIWAGFCLGLCCAAVLLGLFAVRGARMTSPADGAIR